MIITIHFSIYEILDMIVKSIQNDTKWRYTEYILKIFRKKNYNK